MSLEKAVSWARRNPIKSLGRNSISRFGAILVHDRSDTKFFGWNSYKTHPLQKQFGTNSKCIHVHAEIAAIISATRHWAYKDRVNYLQIADLTGHSMYVARVLKDGTPALARPCPGCMSALAAFNITHVEWTE